MHFHSSGQRELKAIILAAGKNASTPDSPPLMLESAGDRTILECVIRNALEVVSPENIHLVLGDRHAEISERLAGSYQYVRQNEALGTADAVLQVAPLLNDDSHSSKGAEFIPVSRI